MVRPKPAAPDAYRAHVGLDYLVDGKPYRVEPGGIARNIPAASVGWLLEQGWISLLAPTSEHVGVADPEG